MHNFHRHSFVKALASVSLALPLLVGCSAQDVRPSVELVDRSTKALSLGSFLEVNGMFGAGCTNRSGAWSVGVGGFASLTNPALTVLTNDASCTLSVDSLRVGSAQSSNLFASGAAIALWSSFASNASPFFQTLGSPVDFYGNLKIQPDLSFSTDFSISLVYSDDPQLVSASTIASSGAQSVTASAGAVASPDYSINTSGIALQVDINKVVQNAGGSAVLNLMTVPGQTFVVSTNDLGSAPSYAMIDAEFQAGAEQTLTGTNPMIPADAFALGGVSLAAAQVRTLIVANTLAGTRSYEAFRILFSAP